MSWNDRTYDERQALIQQLDQEKAQPLRDTIARDTRDRDETTDPNVALGLTTAIDQQQVALSLIEDALAHLAST